MALQHLRPLRDEGGSRGRRSHVVSRLPRQMKRATGYVALTGTRNRSSNKLRALAPIAVKVSVARMCLVPTPRTRLWQLSAIVPIKSSACRLHVVSSKPSRRTFLTPSWLRGVNFASAHSTN